MLSVNPNLTRDQLVAILRGSAQPAGGSTPNDYYGAGIVDAAAAVANAAAYSPRSPRHTSLFPWWRATRSDPAHPVSVRSPLPSGAGSGTMFRNGSSATGAASITPRSGCAQTVHVRGIKLPRA